jgi:hypothetical protein
MACLYDCTFEEVAVGNRMHVEGVGWCIKLEEQEVGQFNAMVEGAGRLVHVPAGTIVTSGYGWGER